MLPIISERDGNRIKIEWTVALSGSMLEAEQSILRAVNADRMSRGRFRRKVIIRSRPVTVAVDYDHNTHGVRYRNCRLVE
jgi:hypothetical protein